MPFVYWFAGSLPLFRPTAGKHDVPVVFHEPHVEAGFRPLGQPWSYYVFSIFQLHNESLNIWTHLLAFALTARKLLAFHLEVCYSNSVQVLLVICCLSDELNCFFSHISLYVQ